MSAQRTSASSQAGPQAVPLTTGVASGLGNADQQGVEVDNRHGKALPEQLGVTLALRP